MSRLDALLERARALPEPSKHERDLQAIGFAYGNLALSTNHRPSRAAFAALAASPRFGWTPEEFDAWANGKEWLP